MPGFPENAVKPLIDLAIAEDLPHGDVTSETIFSSDDQGHARILAKSDLVICGLPVVSRVLERFSGPSEIRFFVKEGDVCPAGTTVAEVSGPVRSLLGAERILLNFLQHLSGIATRSREISRLATGSIRIVDTRKTLPGWRMLQKYAVAVGGCSNHRMSLSSGVLIKDNHIDACGSVAEAIFRVRRRAPHGLRVEVEIRSMDEAAEAVAAGAEILLLDNLSPEQSREMVDRFSGQVQFEISGGIRGETLAAHLIKGVDYVSMGELTHSVQAADLSMKIQVIP